ncbi:MAG TPA: class I SAM-dependent methyltransferase [bacterium]|nr:class I SAM-dependent methyltransferase [bacterium]
MFQKDYWEREDLKDRRSPDHPVVRHYALSKLEPLRKDLSLGPGSRILDLGCGNGYFSVRLNEMAPTVGVDFSRKMLGMNPLPWRFLMGAERLAFQDMAFDLVFCHALLHHVEDMDRVLKEMRRVSRRYVVVMEPNRNNPLMFLFSALVPEERRALKFSLGYLKERMERNGLRVTRAFAHGWTVPNKTPAFLLPLVKTLDFPQPWGMTHVLLAER